MSQVTGKPPTSHGSPAMDTSANGSCLSFHNSELQHPRLAVSTTELTVPKTQ